MLPIATIESLDHDGHGVAHVDGKTLFIDGALPFERVEYQSYRSKATYENADCTRVLEESFMRARPRCPHFNVCGGCSMQHVEFNAQVAVKQRVLEDNLIRIGKVTPEVVLPAIYGPEWGYRHRGRMSARWVARKGSVLVGFHEKRSSFIADMTECHILPQRISVLLVPLRGLIASLSICERMPQIEYAGGEDVDVLVLRTMDPLTAADEALVRDFADRHNAGRALPLQFWLQPKGPDTAHPFYPLDAPRLCYRLPEFGIEMPYKPTEFTQVNPGINRVMVQRAMRLLDPQPGERIADMFCGLGNFTLPIARSGATVLGMEGSAQLIERAIENATHNGLDHRVDYRMANLFDLTEASLAALGKFDKMLIDPPRDGAIDLVKSLNEDAPSRIVYVSCNPATLARDAGVLVNIKGYTLKAAGIVNMFPHTGHVESIAWFEKTGPGLSREEVAALDAAEAEAREAAKAAKKARNAAAAKAKADEEAARVARKAARLAHYLANQAAYDARSAKK
ncbi:MULTISPECIES: 23S rRNA (uracil(1939)-C(5))-methyltransferase RlmD [Microvirgula]|uniref:23S rRNA (uracil(1939)-C(5))-methyltransferase RlmD n=1 Tax=Microvirgula TaxID=57479 RepID=UPI00048AD43F|nr:MULTISPECIES: 23S rRNA (uracil(1939)-C(5))-methyltransferase RlmD [Microvirgula]RAS15901.1 23S rRNA m(5)U-1939 methyltransferase [Microvirgula sp. AG722]